MDDAIPVDGHVVPDRPHQRWGERPAFGCDGPLLDYAQPDNVLRSKPVERPASNKSAAGSAERCAPEKSLKPAPQQFSRPRQRLGQKAKPALVPSPAMADPFLRLQAH